MGCCCAALLSGVAQRKSRPGTTTPCPMPRGRLGIAAPARPQPDGRRGPRQRSCSHPCHPVVPLRVGGCDVSPRLRAGPWWWSQAPAAAWGEACARPRWRQRARLGSASRPAYQEAALGVVGWRRVLRPGLLSVCGPVWGRAVGSGSGGRGRWQRQAHHGGITLPGRRVGHGGVTRSPSVCQVPCPRPSHTVSRVEWPPAAQGVPTWVAAVGHREGRVPASVPSNPTRACRRPPTASAPSSLRLLAAPEAWR